MFFRNSLVRPLRSNTTCCLRHYSQEPKKKASLAKPTLPRHAFVPVINIPESELAHNAFFSLHRPLLGLSNDEEKPFFTPVPTPAEMERELFLQYLSTLRPFVPPFEKDKAEPPLETHFSEPLHIENTLPMHYMPESDQVVEYFTMIEKALEKKAKEGVKGRSTKPLTAAQTAEKEVSLGAVGNTSGRKNRRRRDTAHKDPPTVDGLLTTTPYSSSTVRKMEEKGTNENVNMEMKSQKREGVSSNGRKKGRTQDPKRKISE
ncbi:hypothetical protein BDF14DRAFT_1879066 [Spinellus fusiger]|nr:hypothetical protein BDF14DRAFT_1879066 [Spinellus fusiger]